MSRAELKRLQDKWYKKLEKSGFKDIESEGQWQWHSTYFSNRHDDIRFEANQEYYRLCGYLLYEWGFKTRQQRHIWKRHADGEPVRSIAKAMKIKVWVVQNTIQMLKSIMEKAIWHQLSLDLMMA